MIQPQRMAFAPREVSLLPSVLRDRFELNRRYVMSLRNENLLQNFHWEAGFGRGQLRNSLAAGVNTGEDWHWGWESPTCRLRGHFLGHWLSAAARIWACTADAEIKAKADKIVDELAVCQERNGGGWVGSIPEKYFHWLLRGIRAWAPHYTVHKTLMGLCDMAVYAGSAAALDVMEKFAGWFDRWTAGLSREQMDDVLDVETGGMMEAFADLYALTGKGEHLELMQRYERRRLFEPLLAGEDVLTNRHANTTVPEAHGAARAYEVTGERRWRDIAEAYWTCAVTERGFFCTGGQTCGEIWTPPHELSARRGDKNQEHCVVYNMMRLADYLYRWSGQAVYADYIERNLYNGVLAQQHPTSGMVAYFLPLRAGGKKLWGHPTWDFWCCHGTLVQAHSRHNAYAYYRGEDGVDVCQYVPSEGRFDFGGSAVRVTMNTPASLAHDERSAGPRHHPDSLAVRMTVASDRPVEFALRVRLPWWLAGRPVVRVNGQDEAVSAQPPGFHAIRRAWHRDTVELDLPRAVTACALEDEPATVAFMDGPVVLAGLCDEERTLVGDAGDPAALLTRDNEREWGRWQMTYRTRGHDRGLRLVPLYQVTDEPYAVYFPIRPPAGL